MLDVSPHILVLQTAAGEERLTLAASTAAWRGAPVAPAALKQGDRAIVKRNYVRNTVADRIWAEIGRVTGTIVERDAGTLLVDEGTEQGRKILVIPERSSGRIQVRFPRLQPGYLVDVIGLRHQGFVEGLIPATSQPPYRADQPPSMVRVPLLFTVQFCAAVLRSQSHICTLLPPVALALLLSTHLALSSPATIVPVALLAGGA